MIDEQVFPIVINVPESALGVFSQISEGADIEVTDLIVELAIMQVGTILDIVGSKDGVDIMSSLVGILKED